jgi:hypothetical protein
MSHDISRPRAELCEMAVWAWNRRRSERRRARGEHLKRLWAWQVSFEGKPNPEYLAIEDDEAARIAAHNERVLAGMAPSARAAYEWLNGAG